MNRELLRNHPMLHLLLALLLAVTLLLVAAPTASAQSPCGDSYTVVYLDTLREIAERCDTTVDAILDANPAIANRNHIRVGQVLTMPGPERNDDGADADPTATTYTVKPGDWLSRIADRFGVTVQTLLDTNPAITDRNRIYAGQELTIPRQENIRQPQVLINPNGGPAGTEVTVRAANFPPNLPVEIGVGEDNAEYEVVATATTSADGTLETTVTIPRFASTGEEWVVVVASQAPGGAEDTSNLFAVGTGAEAVSISPRSGPPGTEVRVQASGFPADSELQVGIGELDTEPATTVRVETDATGAASTTIQVPEAANADRPWIVVVGANDWRIKAYSSTFQVVTDGSDEDERGSGALFTRTNIYLVALEDAGRSGQEIGCGDSLVPVEIELEPTIAPLTAALENLLDIDERMYGQSGLYNALHRSDLSVEDVAVIDGEATIRLTGELSMGGTCDEPRVEAQLEQTALQYSTVDRVSITINGEPLR